MTSDRRQTVLKVIAANRATPVGDVWAHETADERLRVYWPAGVVVRSAAGEPVVAQADWRDVYEAGRREFIAQATALAGLSHPNVAAIRAISDLDDLAVVRSVPMGASLATRLGGGAVVRPEAVLALAADLAAGLEAIHARGQLHLNLAPESVGVATGRAVLHDPSVDRRRFIGLVRRLDGLFRAGLSPFEAQDATQSAPLTAATDVYGLCAVLYRVVTGRDAPDWFGWSDDTRLSAQVEAAGYPAGFIAALEKGLSRNADRFAAVTDWRVAAGVGEPAPLEGRVWFDAVEDFRVPAAPPAPVDELALAPPAVVGPADPVAVEGIGALRPTPGPVPFAASRAVTPAPAPRRSKALGLGAVVTVAGLVAVVAFAGSRLTGHRSNAADRAEKTTTRAAPPRAPDGCTYAQGDDLTLRCGPGEGQVVDRGALRVSDVADAAAGHSGAMARLGAFYLRDTPGRDERAGLSWLGKAASAGETSAMLDLADFYETSATDASAAETPAALRQSLQWYRRVSDPAQGASGGARIPSPDQIRLADEGVQRIEARLTEVRDAAFAGCWRSGDVVADLSIDDGTFTLAVEGGEPAIGQIAQPREDDRIDVTLDSPGLMSGQRYLFSSVGADMIEHRLDVSTENARWNRCSAR